VVNNLGFLSKAHVKALRTPKTALIRDFPLFLVITTLAFYLRLLSDSVNLKYFLENT
jgi:hypothetical protein